MTTAIEVGGGAVDPAPENEGALTWKCVVATYADIHNTTHFNHPLTDWGITVVSKTTENHPARLIEKPDVIGLVAEQVSNTYDTPDVRKALELLEREEREILQDLGVDVNNVKAREAGKQEWLLEQCEELRGEGSPHLALGAFRVIDGCEYNTFIQSWEVPFTPYEYIIGKESEREAMIQSIFTDGNPMWVKPLILK